jgi:thioesterase domain-containing protein
LAGRHRVFGLSRPGYGPDEFLPVDRAELLAIHTKHVQELAAGGPFVLAGMSSGGWVAHALTHHLESVGLSPTALVLIDTYLPDEVTPGIGAAFLDSWLTRFPSARIDNEFTSYGWYLEMFAHWTPAPIATPTLFLRCMEPMPGIEHEQVPGRHDWRASWNEAHTVIDVRGHHLNVLMEHATSTAQVIQNWLATLPAVPPPGVNRGAAVHGVEPGSRPLWGIDRQIRL